MFHRAVGVSGGVGQRAAGSGQRMQLQAQARAQAQAQAQAGWRGDKNRRGPVRTSTGASQMMFMPCALAHSGSEAICIGLFSVSVAPTPAPARQAPANCLGQGARRLPAAAHAYFQRCGERPLSASRRMLAA